KTRKRYDLLAVPSANVFRPDWLKHLKGYKAVRLCLDNDDAGRKGQERIVKLDRDGKAGCKLFALRWPEGYPEKCDIRHLGSLSQFLFQEPKDHGDLEHRQKVDG